MFTSGFITYLIHKHTPLHWCADWRKNIQVCSGGKTRLHHGNQRVLRNPCELLDKECDMMSKFKMFCIKIRALMCVRVFIIETRTLARILVTTCPTSCLHSGMFGLKRSKLRLKLNGMTWK